jgi:hypothetical protein
MNKRDNYSNSGEATDHQAGVLPITLLLYLTTLRFTIFGVNTLSSLLRE